MTTSPVSRSPTAALPGSTVSCSMASDLLSLMEAEQLRALAEAVDAGVDDSACVDPEAPVMAPWTRPRKILGIGLNYGAHAGDLGERAPRTSPASFIEGDHTIVGPGQPIVVPPGIGKVTAEARAAGLVIGRMCSRSTSMTPLSYVAGVVPFSIEREAMLLENPRYLTQRQATRRSSHSGPT